MINLTKKITAVFSIVALFALTAMPTLASHNDSEMYRANLRSLNSSGVHGQARMSLDGDQLTVSIKARGYEANKLHPQHIHGFENKQNSTCPMMSADVNNDGVVDLVEGLPDYGPVLLSLEPFPTADSKGKVNFQNSYTVDVSSLGPLENRAIVLHGMTVNGTYDPTLPVACGQIVMTHQGMSNGNGVDGNGSSNGKGSDNSISGNGSNSDNSIDVRTQNDTSISQNNGTHISNDVKVDSDTGNNRANDNTGGHTSIMSGDSLQSIRIQNMAGYNMLSR